VKNRLEFAPQFESTINPEFQHIVGGGLKLEYHLSDMLSIGAVGIGSTQFNTKLTDRIVPTLEDAPNDMTREPSKEEFTSRLNTMPVHGAAYVSITPWYGKLAAFSQAYVAFDFYFQAGVSFAQLKSDCPSNICDDPSPLPRRRSARVPERLPRPRPVGSRLRVQRQPVGRGLQRGPLRRKERGDRRRRQPLPAPPVLRCGRVDHVPDHGEAHALIRPPASGFRPYPDRGSQ
jgi:hypothetical protein